MQRGQLQRTDGVASPSFGRRRRGRTSAPRHFLEEGELSELRCYYLTVGMFYLGLLHFRIEDACCTFGCLAQRAKVFTHDGSF
jgi:hypothetical protein